MGTIFFELALTLYFAGFLLSLAGIVRKKDDLDKAVFFISSGRFYTSYNLSRYKIHKIRTGTCFFNA